MESKMKSMSNIKTLFPSGNISSETVFRKAMKNCSRIKGLNR